MELSAEDRVVLAAVAEGLPLVPRPYAALAERLGLEEEVLLARLRALLEAGVIRRFGVVVRHHELGYRANAMIAWQVPEAAIEAIGRCLATQPGITLCYQRVPRPPAWPHNLFCMIHGRDRDAVLALADRAAAASGLAGLPRAVLFSGRRFQQRGARIGAGREGARWTPSTAAS